MSATCRFCQSSLDWPLVDLGVTPLANHYLTAEEVAADSYPRLPLEVRVCPECLLVQTTENVDPATIFKTDYAYFSSYSDSWLRSAELYAERMIERFGLDERSLVVEIASNDGYLLQYFAKRDVPVLGVEPAGEVADKAISIGVPTEKKFFGRATAQDLAARGHQADLMPANNVLAHVPDIRDFLSGFSTLLKPEGVATFEFPHVLNLIKGVQFDTIYHEHYSYLSLLAVETICAAVGLRVFDVERIPTHGGSLRVFVSRADASWQESAELERVRRLEQDAQLDTKAGYEGFQEQVAAVEVAFQEFLRKQRRAGLRIAAYGAAAKGNTFLNVCGATSDDIEFAVDRNESKQGTFLPGSHIPVLKPDEVFTRKPEILLILPWNLEAEIREQMKGLRDWGGKFAVAFPEARLLDE